MAFGPSYNSPSALRRELDSELRSEVRAAEAAIGAIEFEHETESIALGGATDVIRTELRTQGTFLYFEILFDRLRRRPCVLRLRTFADSKIAKPLVIQRRFFAHRANGDKSAARAFMRAPYWRLAKRMVCDACSGVRLRDAKMRITPQMNGKCWIEVRRLPREKFPKGVDWGVRELLLFRRELGSATPVAF